VRGLRFIETISQDVRYALAGFRRAPGFALTVVATIAVGVGLNTTLFTIFNAYVLQPLRVSDPCSIRDSAMFGAGDHERSMLRQIEYQPGIVDLRV
jgi:hypothetical protein